MRFLKIHIIAAAAIFVGTGSFGQELQWNAPLERGDLQSSGTHNVPSVDPDVTASEDTTYYVNLINRSNLVFVLGAVDQGGGFGTPFPIPRTGRTCPGNETFDSCFANKKWSTVLSVSCRDNNFHFLVCTQPDANGDCSGTVFLITPNCDVAGGVIGLDWVSLRYTLIRPQH